MPWLDNHSSTLDTAYSAGVKISEIFEGVQCWPYWLDVGSEIETSASTAVSTFCMANAIETSSIFSPIALSCCCHAYELHGTPRYSESSAKVVLASKSIAKYTNFRYIVLLLKQELKAFKGIR